MSPDPTSRNDVPPPASPGARRNGAAAADLDRLPPPAFPPGSRRGAPRGGEGTARPRPEPGDGLPSDAFISPDDPLERSHATATDSVPLGSVEAGFISPDDPMPPRSPEGMDATAVVTGMDDDPHLRESAALAGPGFDDPDVAELAERVGRLADALRERGEAGLRAASGMSRFEATLRAYCTGWLAARREGTDGP